MQKIKYITNKELLAEIQKSKTTYCHFLTDDYINYDTVVVNTDLLTPEFLTATLETKRNRLAKTQMPIEDITGHDVVFRVMSDSHLPEETDEKRRKRSSTGGWIPRTIFPPFQHYVLHDDLLIEVGRSHWKGDLETGEFCMTHGMMTNRLATMFVLLVEQYSRRGNWRGYCLAEDHEALTQRGWLGIDEITEEDTIHSYHEGKLTWSKIKSIFRDDYDGKMFKLTHRKIDALVTPGHKFVTEDGFKPVELLSENDRIIVNENDAIKVEEIDFHGPRGLPNVDYKGRVWCLETEHGSFMARRNGRVFLTANSYVSDMRGQALVQLAQVGLQFDESRSANPFAWYTQIIKNVFRRIWLLERRNQDIRDDLLMMAGALPSYTRQVDDEVEQREMIKPVISTETVTVKELPKRRGRKPKVRD